MTYTEYQKRRKYLLKSADKTHIYQRKSRDVKDLHVCALCGRQLTTYLPLSATYIVNTKHYYFKKKLVRVSLCYDAHKCYETIQKRCKQWEL